MTMTLGQSYPPPAKLNNDVKRSKTRSWQSERCNASSSYFGMAYSHYNSQSNHYLTPYPLLLSFFFHTGRKQRTPPNLSHTRLLHQKRYLVLGLEGSVSAKTRWVSKLTPSAGISAHSMKQGAQISPTNVFLRSFSLNYLIFLRLLCACLDWLRRMDREKFQSLRA